MLIIYFILGCVVGSFLCLVAERVPINRSIFFPASRCSFCQTKLKNFELIPIISILFLQFRCRHCKQQLSCLYLFSEGICGLLFVYNFSEGVSSFTIYRLLFLLMAFSLSLTDIYYFVVDPKLFYSFSLFLCINHLYLAQIFHWQLGLLTFMSLSLLNRLDTFCLGGGDVLLISIWGTLLGLYSQLLMLCIASSSGLIFYIFSNYILKKEIYEIPFVPFLSFGLFFVWIM